ncbi:MAG: hypothetical protein MI921_19290 [Cytophagales bacterium]|nr:hypothetical protein [Cytophagales bacterium]
MDQEKAYALLSRQLTDILAAAERIINGNDSAEEIESFARYSFELKRYVNERIENEEFKKAANEIPDINYKRTQIQIWQYLILPAWWINLYKDYQARQKTKEEVNLVRGKYASLQLLAKSQLS